ncbi:MAG: Rieske (2Fe-2S) protein [Pseudonocardia sp.]|nr:Rieske (2Fe-2S) protein [Pseudonocardia sp.]
MQASASVIDAAVGRALARPSGNWYVLATSAELGSRRPLGRTVGGIELVVWRDEREIAHAGPGACPHLGAPLCRSRVVQGHLMCHWHGMRLDAMGRPGWHPFPTYDDGVLVWVRLDELGGEPPLPEPVLAPRPPSLTSLVSVLTMIGRCEPADIVANRFDPWHGSWLHSYFFANLQVLSTPSVTADTGETDRFLVEVSFRVAGPLGVPAVAEFSSPEPRTVLMRIVEGAATGSVVETHATPIGTGRDGTARTAVIEASMAYSEQPGFSVARAAAPVLRPLIRAAAARLWRDDLDYAERRYRLRGR